MVYDNLASLLMRLGFGSMMLTHGWGKLNRLLSGNLSFADPIGFGEAPTLIIAVISEFVAPILIILGLKTRISAIPPALTMLVAAFLIHTNDPWAKQEFPLLYFIGFLSIFLMGSGKYSLDWKLKKL